MRSARRGPVLVAVGLAVVVLAGCGSAEDVATDAKVSPQRKEPTSSPHHTEQTAPSSSPSAQEPSAPTPTATSPSPSVSPSSSPDGPPKHRTLPNVVGAIPTFLTPSHNIGCAIGNAQVRCDIIEHVYRPPTKPADCRGDYGRSIAVTQSGVAAFLCISDTVIDRRAPVLSYGSSSVIGDFGCTSRQSGVRCYHLTSKHGFWLSQEQPVLF